MKKIIPFLLVILAFTSCTKDELSKPSVNTLVSLAPTVKPFYSDAQAIIESASQSNGTLNGKPVRIAVIKVTSNTNIKAIDLMVKNAVIYSIKTVLNGDNNLIDSSNVVRKYSVRLNYKDGTTGTTVEF